MDGPAGPPRCPEDVARRRGDQDLVPGPRPLAGSCDGLRAAGTSCWSRGQQQRRGQLRGGQQRARLQVARGHQAHDLVLLPGRDGPTPGPEPRPRPWSGRPRSPSSPAGSRRVISSTGTWWLTRWNSVARPDPGADQRDGQRDHARPPPSRQRPQLAGPDRAAIARRAAGQARDGTPCRSCRPAVRRS